MVGTTQCSSGENYQEGVPLLRIAPERYVEEINFCIVGKDFGNCQNPSGEKVKQNTDKVMSDGFAAKPSNCDCTLQGYRTL